MTNPSIKTESKNLFKRFVYGLFIFMYVYSSFVCMHALSMKNEPAVTTEALDPLELESRTVS